MDVLSGVNQMRRTANAIHELVKGVDDPQARWKPDLDSWSTLEVVNHLYDEEREDFRVRLDYILHRPGEQAPPIDPQGWVTARRYNERNLSESISNFLKERSDSLNWLQTLNSPNFDLFVEGPFGQISAGDMFAAWTAHDLLHLRQLIELKYLYSKENASPHTPAYAGNW